MPVAAATRGYKMILLTTSRGNNFVGGICTPPSALLVHTNTAVYYAIAYVIIYFPAVGIPCDIMFGVMSWDQGSFKTVFAIYRLLSVMLLSYIEETNFDSCVIAGSL